MLLVLMSHNLGVMWVGMEATTLLTAFLISLHPTSLSLEAMWKYLIICSIGIAFAFMGTLLAAASIQSGNAAAEALFWTHLAAPDTRLDPTLMKFAFVFVLVGYGTKAGLAPIHSWLPDAHSQAPAPVSAMFSGFLLNTALYCIMRFVPPARHALGADFASGLLDRLRDAVDPGGGRVHRVPARRQTPARLLTASSTWGSSPSAIGLGPLGAFAALFHTLNHSVCKSLAFFAVGRLGQRFGSHDMHRIAGALRADRLWGAALLVSLLALIGVAPFSIFMSEYQLLRAAVGAGAWLVAAVVPRRQRCRVRRGAAAPDRHGLRVRGGQHPSAARQPSRTSRSSPSLPACCWCSAYGCRRRYSTRSGAPRRLLAADRNADRHRPQRRAAAAARDPGARDRCLPPRDPGRVAGWAAAVCFSAGSCRSGAATRLLAALADDRGGEIGLFATDVTGSYPALTPECPSAHYFEREIFEQCEHRADRPSLAEAGPFPARRPADRPGRLLYGLPARRSTRSRSGRCMPGVIEPGHFRFQCHGERVLHLEIALGYQHRGVEAALRGGPHKTSSTSPKPPPATRRSATRSPIARPWKAWPAPCARRAPRRLRAVALELERIANHIGDLGALAGDVGFLPAAAYCGRLRGDALNLTAELCGSRLRPRLGAPGRRRA